MQISQRIAPFRPLATTAMHGRVEALRAAGESVIDFSIAISHFAAPESVRRTVADMALHSVLPYTTVGGALALRARLAEKVRRENRIDAEPHEIIVTNGAKQALFEALYVLTDPGDTVIVFRPFWPAYVATAKLLGLDIRFVDLPELLEEEDLSNFPAAKLVILNNPHNPTGKVMSTRELDLLANWMQSTGCGCIVDESYEKLIFSGEHHSLAALANWRELGVVTIFSASQSYAMMGWRSGFAVAPATVVQAMETLQGPITASVSALTQAATGAAFDSQESQELVADYRLRRDLIVSMMAGIGWMHVVAPDSGPYLWCDIRGLNCDTVAFSEQLLSEYRVAVMPGDALGQPGFIRIGFISDDLTTLRAGIDAILAFGTRIAAGSVRVVQS
jgi:aspartate aminotransferase